MERRTFIKNIGASSLLVGLGGLGSLSMKPNNAKHITILHTNDTHSHIDPLPLNDPINPNKGGAARRAQLIERIRKEILIRCCLMLVIFFKEHPISTSTEENWSLK